MINVSYTILEERWASAAWKKPLWAGKGKVLNAILVPEYAIYPEFQATELALYCGDDYLAHLRIDNNIGAFAQLPFAFFTKTPTIDGVLVLVKKHSEGRSISLPGCLVQVGIDVA